MFGEKKGVLLMPCNFTNVRLEWLKDVRVCPLDSDGVHIIGRHGGLTAQDLEPCFEEMRAWVRIAAQILSCRQGADCKIVKRGSCETHSKNCSCLQNTIGGVHRRIFGLVPMCLPSCN